MIKLNVHVAQKGADTRILNVMLMYIQCDTKRDKVGAFAIDITYLSQATLSVSVLI